MPKPRILFTTPNLEHPPAGGPALRIENTIKALHQVAELHVVSASPVLISADPRARRSTVRCPSVSYAPSAAGISENRWIRGVQRILRGRKAVRKDAQLLVSYMKRKRHRHPLDRLRQYLVRPDGARQRDRAVDPDRLRYRQRLVAVVLRKPPT